MPFVYMDRFYAERYKSQLRAIADNCDELNIVINVGCDFDLGHDNINLHYVKKVPQRKKGEVKNKRVQLRHKIGKLTAYHYWSKPYQVAKVVEKTHRIEGDAVLGFSGAGWQELYHVLLAEKKGIPSIHRMRGNGVLERRLNNNVLNRMWNDYIEKMAYSRYSYHIPISSEFRKILISRGIDERIISNPIGLGVDTEMFKPDNSEPEYIGFIGRFTKEKGIEFAIEVMNRTPDLKYLVVGSNDLEYKFPDNVTYIGKVRKYDVAKYINKCKFIIMPSLSEGVPNGVYEAYACGKVVIASPQSFRNDLPMFMPTVKLSVDEWVSVMNITNMVNLSSSKDMVRKWALDNSWSKFGEAMTNEIKKVIDNEQRNN